MTKTNYIRTTLNGILLIFISVTSAWSKPRLEVEAGGTSYGFLKLHTSPKKSALAGGGLASSSTAAEALTNPTANSNLEEPTLSFSYLNLAKEIGASMEALYFAIPHEKISVGLGGRFLKFDDIAGRDEFGQKTGSYGASSFDIALALASSSKSNLSWGIQGHYAQSLLDDAISRGFFMDVALAYTFKNFSLASSAYNVGWANEYDQEEVILPLTLQAGISYSWNINERFNWVFNSDLKRVNDEGLKTILSSEINYRKIISLRLGYPIYTDNEDASIHAGLALSVVGWTLEYAYGSHNDLSAQHHINIEVEF